MGNTLTITLRAITVTADPQSKVYGDADPTLTFKITAGSLVGNDTLIGSLARDPGENVGSYAINQGTLTVKNAANYTLTFRSDFLTITPRAITVTADARSKVYGGADPALTYKITSGNLVGNDTLKGSLSRIPGENVGSYAINQGSITNANYAITYI